MMFVYKCWYVSKYASGIEGKSILDYVIHTSCTDCPVIHNDDERVKKKKNKILLSEFSKLSLKIFQI